MMFFSRQSFFALTIFSLAALSVGCRPRPNSAGLSSTIAPSSEAPGSDWGFLKKYQYSDDLVNSLAARIGCEKTAEYLTAPKGEFWNEVSAVMGSKDVYTDTRERFFTRKNVSSRCHPNTAKISPTAGMERFLTAARAKGHGITFIMHGGFGSHLTKTGALYSSRQAWDALAAKQPDAAARPLRVWRIECSNSYATDERCSKGFIENFKKKERDEPSTMPHEYILWGYSKGGNTVIQALAMDPELRQKTAAVITLGSPIGGGVALVSLTPVLKEIFAKQGEFFKSSPAIAAAVPLAFAMSPEAFSGYLNLIEPAEFSDVERGAASILPPARKDFLFQWLKNQSYDRKADPVFGRKAVPIFHVASLLDVAEMHPFPLVTVKDGALEAKEGSMNADNTQELALISSFKDYPLSDSCVALQHSVIPQNAVPANATTELLGLLRLDHLGLRLSYDDKTTGPIPYDAIVDSIIDAAAIRLQGGN